MCIHVSFFFVDRLPNITLPSRQKQTSRHGGRCLHPSETGGVSPLRQALRAVGVELDPAATADTVAAGRNRGGGSDLRVRSRTSTGSAFGGTRCMVVSKHGYCPWISGTRNGGRGDHGGDASGDVGGDVGGGGVIDGEGNVDVSIGGLSAACSTAVASSSSSRHILGRDVRETLEVEAHAELVTMLWVESCHRARELRQPSGCEEAFRPQAWPIRTFSEAFTGVSAAPSTPRSPPPPSGKKARKGLGRRGDGGRMGAGGGAAAGAGFAVAVTGFVGAERAGLEQLIERMGAELCKSLKRRVTTHLVCKEVRGRGGARVA